MTFQYTPLYCTTRQQYGCDVAFVAVYRYPNNLIICPHVSLSQSGQGIRQLLGYTQQQQQQTPQAAQDGQQHPIGGRYKGGMAASGSFLVSGRASTHS